MPLKYKIGADPEFSILYDGKRVCADQIINSLFKDDTNRSGNTLKTPGGDFGCDGCAATGELRPKPSKDPKEVVDNIKTCLAAFMEKNSQFDLSTLSLWAPIGGHIHLELPEGKREISDTELMKQHKKLMSFYLPILMGEQKTNLRIRMKSYGKITDVNGPGTYPTLEIRTPSAEWLTSEHIAYCTLAYMATVWHEIWEHPRKLNKDIILKTQKQEEALQELAVSDFTALTKGLMKGISKNIREFELYPKFKDEIEFILRPDRVLKEKKKYNFMINEGWGFNTQKVVSSKRAFLSKQKLIEAKSASLGINHNNDVNTGSIADALANRVMAGFKLKYNYFFYGLKEPAKGHLISKDRKIYTHPEIATDEDINTIQEAVNRMEERANQQMGDRTRVKIDFQTSKIIRDVKETYVIGVPFAERESLNFKKTLNLVWDLEKDKLKPLTLKVSPKEQSAPSLPASVTNEDESAVPIDTNSQGASFARNAVREVLQEQANEEATTDGVITIQRLPELDPMRKLAHLIEHGPRIYAEGASRVIIGYHKTTRRLLTVLTHPGTGCGMEWSANRNGADTFDLPNVFGLLWIPASGDIAQHLVSEDLDIVVDGEEREFLNIQNNSYRIAILENQSPGASIADHMTSTFEACFPNSLTNLNELENSLREALLRQNCPSSQSEEEEEYFCEICEEEVSRDNYCSDCAHCYDCCQCGQEEEDYSKLT